VDKGWKRGREMARRMRVKEGGMSDKRVKGDAGQKGSLAWDGGQEMGRGRVQRKDGKGGDARRAWHGV